VTPLQTIDLLLVTLAGLIAITWLARRTGVIPEAKLTAPLGSCSKARWGGEAIVGPLLGFLTGYGLVTTGAAALGADAQSRLLPILAGGGAQVLGAFFCLWIAATQFDGGVRSFLFGAADAWNRLRVRRCAAILVVALGLCPAVLWATVKLLAPFIPEPGAEVHPTIELLRAPDTPAATIALLWLGAVVIAPTAEELFFRGIVQNKLGNWYGDPRWAIAATSAAFAVVHCGQPATMPAIYFLSALLGWLYVRNDNLLAPMIVHAMFNARTMLWETLS